MSRAPSSPRRAATTDELVPLSDRLAVLQGIRVLIALAVVTAAALEPGGSTPLGVLAWASVAYLALTMGVEYARHRARARALPLVRAMLAVDVVYLGAILIGTGGPESRLGFLVSVHLIAVTLLVSYRTGLRVALAQSLLLFVAYVVRLGGIVAAPSWLIRGGGDLDELRRAAIFGSVGFWLVAIATAALSSLNERELRRGKQELRALAEMGSSLEAVERPEEVLAVLLAGLGAGFTFSRSAVVGLTEVGFRVLSGSPGRPVILESDRPDSVMAAASADGRPVLVRDLDPAANPLLHGVMPWAGNVVVVPLMADAKPVGALVVEVGGRRRNVPVRTVDMLGQFAAHAGLALRNAALLAEVHRLAAVDGLTGLANRGALQLALDREMARANRSAEALSLILLDIDHFKAVNDEHGHLMGDEVLRAVGRAIVVQSRTSDVAGRYGGEEFCVVLPGCRGREAMAIAERLRAAVAACESPVSVTVSAGVASLPADGLTVDELLNAADDALYASKAAGRNRTTRSRRPRARTVAA